MDVVAPGTVPFEGKLMSTEPKKLDLVELEKTKDEILRRIAEKVKANQDNNKEFGA